MEGSLGVPEGAEGAEGLGAALEELRVLAEDEGSAEGEAESAS